MRGAEHTAAAGGHGGPAVQEREVSRGLTAAIPMEDPHCSCRLTRERMRHRPAGSRRGTRQSPSLLRSPARCQPRRSRRPAAGRGSQLRTTTSGRTSGRAGPRAGWWPGAPRRRGRGRPRPAWPADRGRPARSGCTGRPPPGRAAASAAGGPGPARRRRAGRRRRWMRATRLKRSRSRSRSRRCWWCGRGLPGRAARPRTGRWPRSSAGAQERTPPFLALLLSPAKDCSAKD